MAVQPQRSAKPVAIWLLAGVFMIIIQIILGGITRLTDSGLSITEWQPILGTVPPLDDVQWNRAFDHYKQIAQFKHLHSYFTLSDFKSIFFWEWLHRLWGRIIGIVFLIPFIIFLVQRRFSANMIRPMIILFLLGGLQGLVGWIMVESGLNEENLYVSHIRLAIHFIVALGLLVYTLWFALQLLVPGPQRVAHPATKKFAVTILVLLVVQLIYGAFMAGLKAANMAPTWPDINGHFIPENLYQFQGRSFTFADALVNNPIMVQLIHRSLAYLLFILIVIWTVNAARKIGGGLWKNVRWLPLVLVCIQVALGIAAILTSPGKVPQHWGVFEWNAALHQFVAMLLLLSIICVLFVLSKKNRSR